MMYPVFYYSPKATVSQLATNGLGVLECEKATVFEEINGEYSCHIETYQLIEREMIIRLWVVDKYELFRLSKPERTLQASGALKYTVRGWHISYDLADDIILDRRFPDWPAPAMVQAIVTAGITEQRFSGTSNITGTNSLNVIRLNPIEALIGDQQNSFKNRFGGEIYRHGWNVDMNTRRGANTSYSIRYRKNLTGLTLREDAERVINRIVPTYLSAPNVAALLPERWIDSNLMTNTAVPHVAHIHFGDIEVGRKDDDGIITYTSAADAEAEVRRRIAKLYADGADRVNVHADVSFVDLAQTEEYKDLWTLATLKLGDTVKIVYENFVFYHRIFAYETDCLTGRYIRLELGEKTLDIANIVHRLTDSALEAAKQYADARTGRMSSIIESQLSLNRTIAGAMGFYTTDVEMSDGRIIQYMHNKPTLEESDYIAVEAEPGTLAWTTTGWNEGNPTWQYGHTKDGNAIFNVISAFGVNAEWVHVEGSDKSIGEEFAELRADHLSLQQSLLHPGKNLIENPTFGTVQSPTEESWIPTMGMLHQKLANATMGDIPSGITMKDYLNLEF